MSPKRLFDEPAEERHRAPGLRVQVTPPPQPAGLCGLAVCLQSALGGVSYARVMGLLNTAFMLHVERSFSPGGTELPALQRLQRAQSGGDDTQAWLLPGDDATDVIETELLAGSAPVAREWSAEHGDGWSSAGWMRRRGIGAAIAPIREADWSRRPCSWRFC